jgi:restriction system protein
MRVTGGAGDLAIDIAGRDVTGRTVLVQCKRYAQGKRIGSPQVQTFLGMARFRDESARRILVTTSDFTEPALEVGRRAGVELVDGATLVRMALEVEATTRPAALRDADVVTPRAIEGDPQPPEVSPEGP